jgi:hypothetical protein
MKFTKNMQSSTNKATGLRHHTEIGDVDEVVMYVEKGGFSQEYLTPDTITKLYFDKDCYDLEASDTEGMDALRVEGCDLIRKYLAQSIDNLPDEDIAIAQRHRYVIKKGEKVWKTSFRFYVSKFSIEYQYIRTLLEVAEDTFFDRNPYNPKEQLYTCIFNAKDNNESDNVVLEPITSHPTEDFKIQIIPNDAIPVDGKGFKEEYEKEQR